MLANVRATTDWETALAAAGFKRRGKSMFHRGKGLEVSTDGGWVTFRRRAKAARSTDPLGGLGRPGLWKHVDDGRGGRQVFELPRAIVDREPDDFDEETSATPVQDYLKWAMVTAEGEVPAGWQPPAGNEIEFRVDRLTLQVGPLARQGKVITASSRLAIRFPILPAIPDQLPETRRAWLRELLTDAQNRWRMVRIGITGGEAASVEAEVDLTGAPHWLLEDLLPVAVDALRWVVEWSSRSADLIADANLESEILNVYRNGA